MTIDISVKQIQTTSCTKDTIQQPILLIVRFINNKRCSC